jgi:hypothetical protein
MSTVYTKVGVKNYLGIPIPGIEVYFNHAPTLIPVTNTEGIATLWSDHIAMDQKGTLFFHDPIGTYANYNVIRGINFSNDDIPQWVILEMNPYIPPQPDLL